MARAVVLGGIGFLCASCSFSADQALFVDGGGLDRDGSAGATDASSPVDAGSGADASCAPESLVDLCGAGDPSGAWIVGGDEGIDTDSDVRCTALDVDGVEACLIHVQAFEVKNNRTLRATGSRPLVIASASTAVIEGEIDLSSRRGEEPGAGANAAACLELVPPEEDLGGAGGGAGGSFGGLGGEGGEGDTNTSLGGDGSATGGAGGAIVASPVSVRGGCAGGSGADEAPAGGQGGEGGASGGALVLYAADRITLSSQARIHASGAGGAGGEVQAGGGGGGSGGFIGLEAPSVDIDGFIAANGGGGGEGGARDEEDDITGSHGDDGEIEAITASGGAGEPGGNGGDGAGGAVADGEAGDPSVVGAGGGGGGVGVIRVEGTLSGSGFSSPPAS